LLVVAAAGCSRPARDTEAKPKQPVEYFRVDPAQAASIHGRVRFEGALPSARRISMASEEACEALHKEPVYDEKIAVDRKRGLANVFVSVKSGLEGKAFAPVENAVVLDQRGCRFVPRVVALRQGQTLQVKNSDPVTHNVHPMPRENRDWNQQQAAGAPDLLKRFARPETMIPVKCDIHSWMRSWIAVIDHPYFAVTDASGGYRIEGLPRGRYVLSAWHEALGEQTLEVELTQSSEVSFEFRARE
jgi:plastocyanin